MKFFIPYARDEDETTHVYESAKQFAKETTGWEVTERRIFSLRYIHEGKEYYSEVGKSDTRIDEVVIAILESTAYLVCTPQRGIIRGLPILVGREEVRTITDFEDYLGGNVDE